MRRTSLILLVTCVIVLVAGCTSRDNKIAEEAFKRGVDAQDAIVQDLYLKATQHAIDLYAGKIKDAVAVGDEAAAERAFLDMVDEYDEITYLAREQYGRAREMLRCSLRYIWEKRGVFSIMKEDFEDAKKRVDDEKEEKTGSG